MNIIAFRLRNIREKKVVIVLPRETPCLRRLIYSTGILSFSSVLLILLIISLGQSMFYGSILEITIFVASLIGWIYGVYSFINALYEQPIMILTVDQIYSGRKLLFRSPFINTSGIIPNEDLQLIIVRDSKLNFFKLYLEGRKLLQLGIYKTLNQAKDQRISLRNSLADFYPSIYISLPTYHEI
ncbi:MAG: hypothetical protein JSW11_04705 [Candidatus Heimdallarchaeota archaeon]|nr:MAG: hypothetical protein JSW11_04705 [Candidatus Heimdallarchaeota archaeon]